MTVAIDPIPITTLVVVILAVISGFIWFGKLSSRVDRLESDVADLKQGQKEILELIHQQREGILEQLHQHRAETQAQFHQHDKEMQERYGQQQNEILALLHQHIGYHQGLLQGGGPPPSGSNGGPGGND